MPTINRMKKLYLLIILGILSHSEIYAQSNNINQTLKSRYFLTVKKFKNTKRKPFLYKHNVYLRLNRRIIFPSDSSGYLSFSGVKSTDTIDLIVKSGRRTFSLNKIGGWHLRDGANVAIGTIPRIWKLKSIAEQDEYLPTDADYATYRKRYRVAPEGTTVDLSEINSLKKLYYITCCSHNGQCVMIYWVTKK
ncbi:MAG: hypothetical protein EOO60_09485 [Hymenobacter sp.]|nr:MAG: hypothetical protein EOO60_09485 [Hymenobacter sp.]